MVQITEHLTSAQLSQLMSSGNSSVSLNLEASRGERLDLIINSCLNTPEDRQFFDLGNGFGFYLVRNNTIISPDGLYLGGVRWKGYDNEDASVMDATKLARGMTHKWAILNLMLATMTLDGQATLEEVDASRIGGGKAVIYDHNFDKKNLSAFHHPELGVPLNDLERMVLNRIIPIVGRTEKYIFAPDMNTDTRHVAYVANELPYNAACLPLVDGGSGDPSVITARGVYEGMLEAVKYRLGKDDLNGLTIAIQGVGKVGTPLIENIVKENKEVKLIITDADQEKAMETVKSLTLSGIGARYVNPEGIYNERFDVFSPNATGQILNPSNTRKMIDANSGKLMIVGGANNQIDDRRADTRAEVEALFHQYNVLYAPDFVVNLGGILNLIYEFPNLKKKLGGFDASIPLQRVKGVRPILRRIFELSDKRGNSTQSLAERLAEEHMARYALFNGHTGRDLTGRTYLKR